MVPPRSSVKLNFDGCRVLFEKFKMVNNFSILWYSQSLLKSMAIEAEMLAPLRDLQNIKAMCLYNFWVKDDLIVIILWDPES